MKISKISSLISIDPGTIKAGLALFKNEKVVKSKQLILKGNSFYPHLQSLKQGVEAFFSQYTPIDTYLALETPFIGFNPQSGLKLGQARGLILGIAFHYKMHIVDISPQEIRAYYGVGNKAKKQAYQDIIKLEYNKSCTAGEDELDAIAIGFTAIHKIRNAKLLTKAE